MAFIHYNDAVCILIEAMGRDPGIGVVGGNLYADADLHPVPSYCESFDSLKQERKEASWFHILTGKVGDKLGIPRAGHTFNDSGQNKDVAYIFGADMMLTRKLFTEAGGFDRDFFMYAEDIDITRRIHEKYKTIYYPKVSITHLFNRADRRSMKLLCIHIVNIIKYFNKWGWFKDEKRDFYNKQLISELKKGK
jgi:GT2 family glycosyltransferase